MAKKNEIVKTNPVSEQLPAFIDREDAGQGLEEIDQFIRPQRVKIVQKMSGEAYSQWEQGTLVLVPEMSLFALREKGAREGQPFYFATLFFFTEYLKCNPIGAETFVIERTMDRNSDVAKRAVNPDLWKEAHPTMEGKFIRYQENLNFIVMPMNSEFYGTPVVLSFGRSHHRDGEKLLSLLKRRRNQGAPIFACVFEGLTSVRKNTEGEWMGISVQNPSADSGVAPFVDDPEMYAIFKALHHDLKERQAQIQVDYDDEVAEAAQSTEY